MARRFKTQYIPLSKVLTVTSGLRVQPKRVHASTRTVCSEYGARPSIVRLPGELWLWYTTEFL